MVRIFSQGGVPADTIEVFSNVDPDDIDRRSR
jgi:hypothetical protein